MTTSVVERRIDEGGSEPTVGAVWQGAAGRAVTDELLDWPPDLFAFTEVILERGDVCRFVLSPPAGVQWPPRRFGSWRNAVQDAAWWEAMDVPRMELQFLQVGEEVTIVSLVCEDLAQNDDIAAVIRAVGPTIVSTALLDGPQLTSRWAARYASVLADDPGSAVLTLTSFGMAQRSQPATHDPSPVIALIKDADHGAREIALKSGSHGVLLTLSGERATRRSADGRRPVRTGTHYSAVAVHQVRASGAGTGPSPPRPTPSDRLLHAAEITILTGWAEGVAEALAHAPARTQDLLADAGERAPWRTAFGLAEPTPALARAVASIGRALAAATPVDGVPSFDAMLVSAQQSRSGEPPLERLTRRVLRSALEQLRTRQGTAAANGD